MNKSEKERFMYHRRRDGEIQKKKILVIQKERWIYQKKKNGYMTKRMMDISEKYGLKGK